MTNAFDWAMIYLHFQRLLHNHRTFTILTTISILLTFPKWIPVSCQQENDWGKAASFRDKTKSPRSRLAGPPVAGIRWNTVIERKSSQLCYHPFISIFQNKLGDFRFDVGRFSRAKNVLFQMLRRKVRLVLEISPFISTESANFFETSQLGLLVKQKGTNVPALTSFKVRWQFNLLRPLENQIRSNLNLTFIN